MLSTRNGWRAAAAPMHAGVTRREVVRGGARLAAGGTLGALLGGGGRRWALAQATGAGTALAALGLPELKVTVTDSGFEGLPPQVAAGRYLLSLTIQAKPNAQTGFVQLPTGITIQTFLGALTQVGQATAAAQAGVAPWFYQTYMAGGAGGATGQTAQAVIDLKPGNYAVWGDGPSATQQPQALTVTGTAPAKPPTPAAAVTIREVNAANGFAFDVAGTFKAGPQVVAVVNASNQPHFVEVDKSPVPLTQAQLTQIVGLLGNATPPAGLPQPAQFEPATYAAIQSPGTTTWHAFDLAAGTYALLCFLPDERTGEPHAMEGMATVVTVG